MICLTNQISSDFSSGKVGMCSSFFVSDIDFSVVDNVDDVF